MPIILFILTAIFAITDGPSCYAFTPTQLTKSISITTSKHQSPTSRAATNLYSNSAHQAEQYIANQFPKFYYMLQQNPTCLERIQNSQRGFAIFAPSEAAMDDLGDSLNLLEYGCNDSEMLPIVQAMTAYHVVSVPITADTMRQFNVVSTPEGELPVQMHEGSMYVNGVRILQCFRFEDNVVRNYEDKDGNLLGSETIEGEGSACLVYEMEGMVCSEELWEALYECYQSKSSGAEAM